MPFLKPMIVSPQAWLRNEWTVSDTICWPTPVGTPTNASWLSRIEAQFQALRYFTLDGTDHTSHSEQASMIRRYSSGETTRVCPGLS